MIPIIVLVLAVAVAHGKPVEIAGNDGASVAPSVTIIAEDEGVKLVGKENDDNLLTNAHENVPVAGQEASKEPIEQDAKVLLLNAGTFLTPILSALMPSGRPAPPPVPQSEVVVLPSIPGVPYAYSSNSLTVEPGSSHGYMIVPPPQAQTPYASNVIFVRPQ